MVILFLLVVFQQLAFYGFTEGFYSYLFLNNTNEHFQQEYC